MILAEVFCANLGGSATMCGDPPNIIIGTSPGIFLHGFPDQYRCGSQEFPWLWSYCISIWYSTRNCGPARQLQQAATRPTRILPKPLPIKRIYYQHHYFPVCGSSAGDPRTNRSDRILYWCIHFYRDFNCSRQDALKLIRQIDYKTLLFFIGLFMVVGGLEQTGILKVMANFIGDISNGNLMLMIAYYPVDLPPSPAHLWIIFLCGYHDPDYQQSVCCPERGSVHSGMGIGYGNRYWGSATPIGASANVVGIATAAKAGHMIKWGKYCKVMAPATIIVVGISMLMIYARYL